MNKLIPLILGMAAVTYGPRLIPFLLMTGRQLPPRLDAFLKCIPAAAIGALIIPGVFSATPAMPLAAASGMVFTLAFGLWRGGIIIPVLGSVGVTYLILFFAG
ncbi:MAG: AzlD domain-containing protein [Desulfobacula sp.]|nr:AzlD domain-containing protein [Desulfobacula sp.]